MGLPLLHPLYYSSFSRTRRRLPPAHPGLGSDAAWRVPWVTVEHSRLTSSQQIKVRTLAFHHYYSVDSQPQMRPNMRRPGCYAIRVYKHKSTDKQEVTGENKDASRVKALHSLPDRGIKIIRTLVGSMHEQF